MVEGINIKSLVAVDRMNNLVVPGFLLFLSGLVIPFLLEEYSDLTGFIASPELDFCNGICSLVLLAGIALFAFGITYRRGGNISRSLLYSLVLLFSIDALLWVYFVILNWLPGPSGIFLIPYAALGQIPLLLTLFFIFVLSVAHFAYIRDPRRSGRPRYLR